MPTLRSTKRRNSLARPEPQLPTRTRRKNLKDEPQQNEIKGETVGKLPDHSIEKRLKYEGQERISQATSQQDDLGQSSDILTVQSLEPRRSSRRHAPNKWYQDSDMVLVSYSKKKKLGNTQTSETVEKEIPIVPHEAEASQDESSPTQESNTGLTKNDAECSGQAEDSDTTSLQPDYPGDSESSYSTECDVIDQGVTVETKQDTPLHDTSSEEPTQAKPGEPEKEGTGSVTSVCERCDERATAEIVHLDEEIEAVNTPGEVQTLEIVTESQCAQESVHNAYYATDTQHLQGMHEEYIGNQEETPQLHQLVVQMVKKNGQVHFEIVPGSEKAVWGETTSDMEEKTKAVIRQKVEGLLRSGRLTTPLMKQTQQGFQGFQVGSSGVGDSREHIQIQQVAIDNQLVETSEVTEVTLQHVEADEMQTSPAGNIIDLQTIKASDIVMIKPEQECGHLGDKSDTYSSSNQSHESTELKSVEQHYSPHTGAFSQEEIRVAESLVRANNMNQESLTVHQRSNSSFSSQQEVVQLEPVSQNQELIAVEQQADQEVMVAQPLSVTGPTTSHMIHEVVLRTEDDDHLTGQATSGEGVGTTDTETTADAVSLSPSVGEDKVSEITLVVENDPGDPTNLRMIQIGDTIQCHSDNCNYRTSKLENWYRHLKRHNKKGKKEHPCELCSYRATTSTNLKRHMLVHTDEKHFECDICGFKFRQKIHLDKHIKYKHEEKVVKCPYCDYVCANENPDLKVHMKRRHLPQSQGKDGLPLSCKECGFIANTKRDLKQHEKFHKKGPELKFFCEHCSFVTDCESRLKRHQIIHTKRKPYGCTVCDYRGSQKEHVIRHMKSKHHIIVTFGSSRKKREGRPSEQETIMIQMVDGKIGIVEQANQHQEVRKKYLPSDFTTKEKLFSCTHCTMKFAKLINLYKHLQGQHQAVSALEDETSMTCIACPYRTVKKRNMLVHMRKHSFPTDQRQEESKTIGQTFSCMLCEFRNVRKRSLYEHMSKTHGLQMEVQADGTTTYIVSKASLLPKSVPLEEETSNANDSDSNHKPSSCDLEQIVTEDLTVPSEVPEDITIQTVLVQGSPDEAMREVCAQLPSKLNHSKSADTSLHQVVGAHQDTEGHEHQDSPEESTDLVVAKVENIDLTAADTETVQIVEGVQVATDPDAHKKDQKRDHGVNSGIDGDATNMSKPASVSQNKEVTEQVDNKNVISLTYSQIQGLSPGDYLEINGEMYKVESA